MVRGIVIALMLLIALGLMVKGAYENNRDPESRKSIWPAVLFTVIAFSGLMVLDMMFSN